MLYIPASGTIVLIWCQFKVLCSLVKIACIKTQHILWRPSNWPPLPIYPTIWCGSVAVEVNICLRRLKLAIGDISALQHFPNCQQHESIQIKMQRIKWMFYEKNKQEMKLHNTRYTNPITIHNIQTNHISAIDCSQARKHTHAHAYDKQVPRYFPRSRPYSMTSHLNPFTNIPFCSLVSQGAETS